MEGVEKKSSLSKKSIGIISILFLLALILGAFFLYRAGWRINGSIEKINYLNYTHSNPDFSFRYPDYYQVDTDQAKKFGADYLVGIKLKTDQRTGCDIRQNLATLDLSQSETELQKSLSADLAKSAKQFKFLSGQKNKLANEPAYEIVFSFLDPMNDTVRLREIFTAHNVKNYQMICGTGDYQYKYFQRDFQNFLTSLAWQK